MGEDDYFTDGMGYWIKSRRETMAEIPRSIPVKAEIELEFGDTSKMTIMDLREMQKALEKVKITTREVSESLGALGGRTKDAARTYTDEEFESEMGSAELTGYGRAINDVIILVSENTHGSGTDSLIERIRALHDIEEG